MSTAVPVSETSSRDGGRPAATIRWPLTRGLYARVRTALGRRVQPQPGDGVPDRADLDPRGNRHRRAGQRGALGGGSPRRSSASAIRGSGSGRRAVRQRVRPGLEGRWRGVCRLDGAGVRRSGVHHRRHHRIRADRAHREPDLRRRGRPPDAAQVRTRAGDDADVGPHRVRRAGSVAQSSANAGAPAGAPARSTTSGRSPAGRSVSLCSRSRSR